MGLFNNNLIGHAWITPEKKAIRTAFHKHIMEGKLPSFKECRQAIQEHSSLRRRSVAVIKAHVNNEINRERRKKRLQF